MDGSNLQGVKRVVTLLAGLSLLLPALHFEASLFDRLNAALGNQADAASSGAAPDLRLPHLDVPDALQPLIDALHR